MGMTREELPPAARAQYDAAQARRLVDVIARRKPATTPKPSKYRNVKTLRGGLLFDSKREADRWTVLRMMELSGIIFGLRRQMVIALEVKDVLVCKYIGDFAYQKDGEEVIEDVKSNFTRKNPVYRIKKKLVYACCGIKILET